MQKFSIFMHVIIVCCSFVGSTAIAREQVVDRIAAVIENEIITVRELNEKAAPFLSELSDIKDLDARAKKRHALLLKVLDIQIGERMVEKEIAANRDRLGVTEQEIDRAIEEVLRLNNMDRTQLQAALYGQGLTWSEYRRKLKDQLERARLIQFKVQGRVQINQRDVKRLCKANQSVKTHREKVCAAHILLSIPAVNPKQNRDQVIAQVKGRAAQLQAELSAGADFSAYALKYSDDKSAPDGSLGCFGRGDMVDAFEQVAFATTVGKVSPVVRTEFGFHIIKVLKRHINASTCSSDEDLQQFRNQLQQTELERQMNLWIAELRKRAFVNVRI